MSPSKLLTLFLVLFFTLSLIDDAEGWRRRRRRRRCTPVNCAANGWGRWSSCNCNSNRKSRYRYKSRSESCGRSCNINFSQSTYCCCRRNCVKSNWGNWGSCSQNCGGGNRRRYRYTVRSASCGGSCSNSNSQIGSCGTRCCSVNCAVNGWGSWSGGCPCGTSVIQRRYRSVSRSSSCGGGGCPSLSQSRRTACGCCRQDCLWTWGSWSTCSSSCGRGSQSRGVVVTRSSSCGGSSCPSGGPPQICDRYVNRDCRMNSWSSYSSCRPSNGRCGSGRMYRYRSVAVSQSCRGASCGSKTQSASCSAGCCGQSCAVNGWGSWSSCSATCGSGLKYQYRYVSRNPSCGGSSCPSLRRSTSCSRYNRRDCSVGGWSPWRQCSTQCGTGTSTRTRRITTSALCGGSCPALSQGRSCTSYAANRDCKVNGWGNWGSCSRKCAAGSSYRYRSVSQSQNCRGSACSSLSGSRQCGSANGGCQQSCNNNVCSCNSGYLLNSDRQTCRPRDCGQPSVKYCPSGTTYGTTCKYPTYSCSSGTTYAKTCSVQCPTGYQLKNGPSVITCLSSGTWTPYHVTYCSRINKPPTKISLSNDKVNENAGTGSVVGSFTTSDPNPRDTHSYQLLDSAGGKFKLSGSSLLITFSPNYESPPNSYRIKVRSTDNKGLYLDVSFSISILNVNERPTGITLSNSYVNENSGKGTTVGSLGTSDPDNGQTHAYSLLDNGGGRFSVNGNQLQVAVANTRCLAEGGNLCLLNYEGKSSYTVKVRSQDNGSPPLYKDVVFTIRLRDVNDLPRSLRLSGYTLREDAQVGTVIGDLSASDEDVGQKLTFTLSSDAGGRFAVQSGTKVVRKSGIIDYETSTSYKIIAVATDNGKPVKSISKQFTIEILNVNEPPVSITFSSTDGQQSFSDNNPSINENSVKGTIVGTVVAFDADANQKLAFRLDDTAGGRFALKTSALKCTSVNVNNLKTKCTVPVTVNGVLNHEVDSLHTIVVRVTDEHKLFKTARYSMKIIDVNDRPRDITFSGGAQPSIQENKNGAALGSFKTTDDDPTNVHKYSLTNSAGGRFAIKGSTLMTSSSANLNYELQSQYTIVVRSTDSGSPPLYVEKTFTVRVLDVNEAPTAVALKNNKIAENSPLNTIVGTLSTADPDNEKSVRQTFTYTLLDSAQGRFKVENGVVKVALSNARCLKFGSAECKFDYETAKSHKIVIRTTDNGSPPILKDFTVTISVTDANDQPRNLAIDTFSVKENAPADTLVGTFTATDEDSGQILSYQLTDSDKGQFKLKGSQLLKAKPADYETKTSHSITVVVSDNGNPKKSMTKTFTVEVLNVNEPPVTIRFKDTGGQLSFAHDSPRVNENSALKTAVGIVEGHDEDAGQTLTFSLDDNAGGLFQVATGKSVVCSSSNSISGVNTVCTASITVAGALNYEGSGKHTIIVRVTDKGGLFKAVRFTVTVVDVNDKPTDIQLAGGSPQVVENKNGAVVGGLVTTDDDTTQSHTYKLVSDAGGRFVVAGTEIKVSQSANLDYESSSQHTIIVTSTDSGSPALSVTKTFVIKVLDVNERPTGVSIDNDQVAENSAVNTAIGTLSTSDPDNSHSARQTFTYKLIDGASSRFKLDGNAVKVAASNLRCLSLGGKECVLNFEDQKQHSIIVRATDSGSPALSIDYTLTIRLTDVNDRPRNLDLSNDRVFENEKTGTVVGVFSSDDEDAAQNITYSLTDDDNGRFQVMGNALQKAVSANYETAKSHTVTVLAKDNGNPSLSISKSFSIEVLDVNEAPIRINITDDDGQLSFAEDQPQVEEHSALATVIGKIIALDHDENETLAFRLDDDADGRFSLGTITCIAVTDLPGINTKCWTTLKVNADLNYEGSVNHYIEIRTTDTKGLFFTRRFNVAIVDINDVPHDIELHGDEVDENLNDQLVGSWTTEDADPSHTHTYTLVGNAGGRFMVKGNSLYTSSNANLDFEAKSEYNVTVRSTDNGIPPLFREETFLITVRDINEAPTLILVSNLDVVENSPVDTGVGIVSVIDPDNFGPAGAWQIHNCSAIDNARGRFIVESNALKVADSSLNFEVNSSWSVVLRCVDSGRPQLYKDQEFVIAILDENELPTGIHMQNGSVEENLPAGQVAAIFSTSDPDNEVSNRQSFIYTLEGALDDFPFEIVGNELRTTRSLDFEENPSWKVIIRSTDTGGLFITETFQVAVINVNDGPTGIKVSGTSSVPENSVGEAYIGDVFAIDEDVKDGHTFVILAVYPGMSTQSADKSVSGLFQVNSSTGILTVMKGAQLDYEAVKEYTVEITTTDSGIPGLSFTEAITINITDLNETPTNITLSNDKVDENSSNGTVVGRLTVIDPDNENANVQTHACVVLDYPDEPFQIVNDSLLVVAGDYINYEQEKYHIIDVRCSDDGIPSAFIDQQFVIQISDVNEAPVLVGLTAYTVKENLDAGSLVGIVTSLDPDNEVDWMQNVTYSLDDVNTTFPFAINGTDLVTTAVLDFEVTSSYVISLTATDNGSPSISVNTKIAIHVENVNDQPTHVNFISSGVKENSPGYTVVGTFDTVDEDLGQNHSYTIVPTENVTSLFYVDGNKLIVASGSELDYEEEDTFVLTIRTTDTGIPPLSYENGAVVKVLDVNEPPTAILSYYEDEIDENSAAGTFVANLTVIDPDFNQTHTCRLLNGSQYFTVVEGPTPELLVADNADIDFEKDSTIWVLLRCTDDGQPPLRLDHSFVVKVVDVNERVTEILLTGSRLLREDLPVGALIGNLSVVDQDVGQTHYLSLAGFSAGAFRIDNEGRQLLVAQPVHFDFERLDDPVFNVTIFVVDDGLPPLNFTSTFFFTVVDINEAPANVTIEGGGVEVYENATAGDLVGILVSINPEGDGPITYTLLSVDGLANSTAFYLITNSSGSFLYLNTTIHFDEESSFALEILAVDSGNPPASAITTLDIGVRRTDPCALGTAGCDARATCFRTGPTSSDCRCNTGYNGDGFVCDDIDHCRDTTVDTTFLIGLANVSTLTLCNNGTCVDGTENYTCACYAGYTGSDCSQLVDECASSPCGGGGHCLNLVNGFKCDCLDGFRGVLCEENIDECASSPCGVGTCHDGVATFTCTCPADFTGDVCSFSTATCQDGDKLCRQGQCVPTAANVSVITTTPEDDLPGVVISTGNDLAGTDDGSQAYACVLDQYVITLVFPSDLDVDGADFQKQLERYLRDNLYIPVPDPDSDEDTMTSGISSVYIVKTVGLGDGRTQIQFVVLVNNEPASKNSVLIGLREDCDSGSLKTKFGSETDKITCDFIHEHADDPTVAAPLVRPSVGSPGPVSPFDTIWPIAVVALGVVVLVLSALLTLLYVRKRQKKHRLEMANRMFPWDSDSQSDDIHGEYVANGTQTINPIYDHINDDESESGEFHGFHNPTLGMNLNGPFAESEPITYTNPVYDSLSNNDVVENPIYDKTAGSEESQVDAL